ncbi:MAG: hypothetical protein CO030_01405 [Candidatus Magasanikbacteria bacterium CG_4_9_14_0_2_um_filter_42_11]|uniref:DUF8128 domain-containing protein n=1 Tax=Candidatus Magasanikbacteria bacterium CG_4_9_14_0_2_um_filter_42_11 TaxID=1974643 RepID=A0A2M8FAF5_9BACT|nr:MAG: hypothetical protein COY70_03790 [Candidatus Magasanikbacteria bacterium CG_4_10_14_0_8_um_filter_42_12]PJC52712.1 MAG: hypothetical protein CO030_01405 [Candidatus Magasanikbacteria bacterium CG_4_9_14_0_2_um_filter_42_11]
MDVFGLFTLNLTGVISFFQSTSPTALIVLGVGIVGWLPLIYLLLFAGLSFYKDYREDKFTAKWEWIVLAIDIPQLNIQTPMAVEQLFSHLAGAYDPPGIRDVFYRGHKQRWFSFEIISIEGYIQFVIRTEKGLRDLVEASVYAQYPQAEITEVQDYVSSVPDSYPNATHDIWIADIVTAEDDSFPLRSYREFEHSISKDTVLKDPMGTFLESFSRIGIGEQMWFQILVQPIGNKWKEDAIKKVKELIGEKSGGGGKSIFSGLTDNALTKEVGNSFSEILAQLTGTEATVGGADAKSNDREEPNQMRYMTPGQMKLVEGIELKISKIGFKTKMRGVYVAQKASFNPDRGVHALLGAITQFNIPSANSLVPAVTTSQPTPKQSEAKKAELLKAFKKRKMNVGANPFVLNIEELATVWHFPMSHVVTPMLQKAQLKTAEPPSGLPIERALPVVESSTEQSPGRTYIDDSGQIHYVDDQEQRFG